MSQGCLIIESTAIQKVWHRQQIEAFIVQQSNAISNGKYFTVCCLPKKISRPTLTLCNQAIVFLQMFPELSISSRGHIDSIVYSMT